MKTKLIMLTGLPALLCLALPLRADQLSNNDETSRDRDEAQPKQMQHLGDLRRMNQIIGQEITNDQGEKLGKVKDLALDLQNGRIAEVIVATGGTLGVDEKLVAVPPMDFTCDRTMKVLKLNKSREEINNAPEFNRSHWKDATEYAQVREVYQRFGAEPYFTHDQVSSGNSGSTDQRGQVSAYYSFHPDNAMPRLGYVARATSLTGVTVRDSLNEPLGKISSFVMDLPAGRVVEIVLTTGGFIGMGGELSAVPPQAFRWNEDNTALTLDISRDAFKAAPHFKSATWGYATEPASVVEVYSTYHVEPYFVTVGLDGGAQNVREPTGIALKPIEPANNGDLDITEQIRKAVQADESLSADAKNVKILTTDGKVTLVGPVENNEEKLAVGKAAAKIVSADKVNNQLDVKQEAAPTDINK